MPHQRTLEHKEENSNSHPQNVYSNPTFQLPIKHSHRTQRSTKLPHHTAAPPHAEYAKKYSFNARANSTCNTSNPDNRGTERKKERREEGEWEEGRGVCGVKEERRERKRVRPEMMVDRARTVHRTISLGMAQRT